MSAGTATAVAHPNIALVKYWGKRDEDLVLPVTGSLSLTLDTGATRTTVDLDPAAAQDTVELDGATSTGVPHERVATFLDLVRERAGRTERARVTTVNTVPTGAGLASSASGFAALALAAAGAYGLELDERDLSRLARRGSGSASRSVFGGLAVWHAGHDDASSFAEPVATDLGLGMVVVVLTGEQKAVSSRVAMRRTVDTSPFYPAWARQNPQDLADALAAVRAGDLARLGEITENNALRMHATMLGAVPPVVYWSAGTLTVLHLVQALRRDGLEAWATMDAGPNVKVLCSLRHRAALAQALADQVDGARLLVAGAGPAARLETP
ncbi:diphosphomevalonate decarboxylase [Cellulomonas sp. PhB143]|uniref:diphosphomevalonate decarboxylase n=1 Tax=Cellulomonas sp. PhB143 TaxID=2485186 RepID=UPI000F49E699|nr:diphosphomevalonate decarboxylase [Cellulomonas sp. PhB143]ROS74423.1 diphosphomevalonate decarboxylase [Cellulomonas sp. PhB143]